MRQRETFQDGREGPGERPRKNCPRGNARGRNCPGGKRPTLVSRESWLFVSSDKHGCLTRTVQSRSGRQWSSGSEDSLIMPRWHAIICWPILTVSCLVSRVWTFLPPHPVKILLFCFCTLLACRCWRLKCSFLIDWLIDVWNWNRSQSPIPVSFSATYANECDLVDIHIHFRSVPLILYALCVCVSDVRLL